MDLVGAGAFILAVLPLNMAGGQVGALWRHTPSITVISSTDEPRLGLVDEAVLFWNKALEEGGSGFRLGPVTRIVQPVPEEALQSLSRSIIGGGRWPAYVPQPLRDLPGDLTILLGESDLVSFTHQLDANPKRVIGIRGARVAPMNLPNVARNVIAHELGHGIGLGHNSDPSALMCGRPAPCRPDLFRSDEPRLFPLTADERRQHIRMYPSD